MHSEEQRQLSLTDPSAREDMTFPSADRDLFMFLASSSTDPSAPVLLTYKITKESKQITVYGTVKNEKLICMGLCKIHRINPICSTTE